MPGLGPKIKAFDAARLECAHQNDVIVSEEPFGDQALCFQQELTAGTDDKIEYAKIYVDKENVDELIEILEHFKAKHEER